MEIRRLLSNKRGWVKIVEAFIAILLISSSLLIFYTRQQAAKDEEEFIRIENAILDEVTHNDRLREDIMSNRTATVSDFIKERLPGYLNFTVLLCALDSPCGAAAIDAPDIYVRERIISATLNQYAPKKLKLFVWEK